MSLMNSSPRPRDLQGDRASRSPSVSVVIPYYDSAATIGRALSSVAAQTMPPIEVIIVDDCSQPAQRAALDALRDEEAAVPVRVLHQEANGGPPPRGTEDGRRPAASGSRSWTATTPGTLDASSSSAAHSPNGPSW